MLWTRRSPDGFAAEAWIDVRSALRSIARYPVAAGVAVLSLGVGIGAATATLALRDALFTNPPPLYANPAQLSLVRVHLPDRPRAPVVPRLYRAWAEDRTLAGALAAASAGRPADARTGDRRQTVTVRAATADLFRVLGVAPALGRTFVGAPAAGPPPVLLSYRLWQMLFGERPDVLGATLWLNDEAHTVIGVLPQHFWFASLDDPVWTLADIGTLAPETALDVVVRRGSGLSPPILRDRLQAAAEIGVADLPADARRLRVEIREMAGTPIGEAMGPIPMFLFGAAVLFTVLIACTNIATLMMAQWTTRQHEIAIRASIGASRGRIVRTLVAEPLLIAVAGGALGVGVTLALGGLIVWNGGEFTAFNLTIRPYVFVSVAAMTMLAGLATGLLPALRETSDAARHPVTRLRVSDRPRQRWRHALVAFEIAVTVALLVTVGTLISATRRTFNADLGFDLRPLAIMRLQNAKGIDVAQALSRLSAMPGVARVSTASAVPFGPPGMQRSVAVDSAGSQALNAERVFVGTEFFDTLGVPIKGGRDFHPDERNADSRSVLVSEVLASRLWPGLDAIGRDVWIDGRASTVVGIVGQYSGRQLQPPKPMFFLPQVVEPQTEVTLVIRAAGQPGPLLEAMRREIQSLAPGHLVTSAIGMQQIVEIGGQEILVTVVPLAPLIGIAMLLSAAGVYGVLAFAVAHRGQELAVRMAIGATRGEIARLVAAQSLRVVAAGLAAGIGATFGLTRLVQGSGGIFDSPGWPAFIVPMLIVIVVGLVATWIPARRAMRIDPVHLLRAT